MTNKTRYKYNWGEADRYLGKLTDGVVSDKFGIPRQRVANRRIERGIPVLTRWSCYEHLLGVLPDAEVAVLLNIKTNAVTQKRIRAGISAPQCGKERELEMQFCRTLTESFEQQVKTKWGIIDILTQTSIYECKTTLTTSRMHRAIGQLICYTRAYPGKGMYVVCREVRASPEVISVAKEFGIEIIVQTD